VWKERHSKLTSPCLPPFLQLDSFLYRIYATPGLVQNQPQLAGKLGFVKEGLLEKSLEEGSTSLSQLATIAPLTKSDMQVMHLLFDDTMGGQMNGPLNWYRTRRVHYQEDQGENVILSRAQGKRRS
jgi:hypothetical protein